MSREPAGQRPLGAVALALFAIASIQSGAALAVGLFDQVGPAGAVFLRNLLAIPVLFVIGRPRLRSRSRADLWLGVRFGIALAVMNLAIYAAIDRLPLGVAVTIEFLGPLGVAMFTGGSRLAVLWAALAALGVVALAGPFSGGTDALGIVFALIAAAGWASYILLGPRLGRAFPGVSGLAFGVTIAALLQLPLGVAAGGSELLSPAVLAMAAGVALLSTVIPYAAEIEALRRIPTAPFGVLMSLEPAIAALIGFLALGQDLLAREIAGIVLVILASAGAIRTARLPAPVRD